MILRQDALQTLAEHSFDVAVIGGGITGAGVALDAASRGYSVALVEKGDFASGTSSRSSKLVHGGLRYLQNFDLGLVREALLERQLMVRLAPHLVRPLPMVVATFDGARPDRLMGIGLNMYDVMSTPRLRGRLAERRAAQAAERSGEEPAAAWSPERHRVISGEEVAALLPALRDRQPSGGYLFYDCQTDDARLVLTVLAEAERFGAIVANRLEVVELLAPDAPEPGVLVRDALSGERFPLRAFNVVNATGVWADRLRPEELHSEAEVPTIAPSRGTHITLSASDLPLEAAAIVPAGGGRSIFALPWLGRSLIGTTDNNYDGDIEHVQPPEQDVAYLLDAVNAFFGTRLGSGQLTGAFAGVRPLIATGDSRKSVDISRKAELYETSSGMITITGGKLTTWRRMAKLAVDRIVERDGRTAPCRTHEIPLGEPVDPDALDAPPGVSPQSRSLLASRYGHAAEGVLEVAAEPPPPAYEPAAGGHAEEPGPPALSERILPGQPDLLAEAVYAARHEQALSVADVLLRRTRLGLLAAPDLLGDARAPLRRLARVMAAEHGWDAARVEAEIDAFVRETASEAVGAPAAAAA